MTEPQTGTNYTYDAIYELTQVTQGGSTTESFTYDPVGNRSTSATGSYGYNSSNEMTSSPTATFTFDYNGNTTTKTVGSDTTSYTWDYENRLNSVTLPGSGGTVTFKYDPFGRRIYKSSSAGTSIFAYDGANLIEETNAAGAVVARYAQNLNIDEPLVMLRSGTTSYYQADGLGTVTSLSNGAGTLAQTYSFDSFGNQTASSGSLINPFRYAGREFDSESTIYYMRARYFDPATGRFLNEDPVGFNAGSNFYRYVTNNPIGLRDPFGLCPPTRNQRLALGARGLLNLGIGVGKVAVGIAVTAETGGFGAALGYYAVSSGIVGNIGAGISQIAGAATGDVEGGEKGADAAQAVGSISGLATLAATKGNICRAAQVAQVEGVALTAFGAGMGEMPKVPDKLDFGQNAYDLVTGAGCQPQPQKCSSENCHQ